MAATTYRLRGFGSAFSSAFGQFNTASGYAAFVGGGYSNTASGESAFIGGGDLNAASGQFSFVGGGDNDTAGPNTCAYLVGVLTGSCN